MKVLMWKDGWINGCSVYLVRDKMIYEGMKQRNGT